MLEGASLRGASSILVECRPVHAGALATLRAEVTRLRAQAVAAEGGPEGAAAEQQLVDSFDANFGALVAMRRDGAPFEPAVAEACYAAMAYLPDAALSELTTQLTLVSVQLVADGERKGWHREAVPAA